MRRILRHSVFFGATLLALGIMSCEPQFEDDICDTDDDCFPDEECVDAQCVLADNACAGDEDCASDEECVDHRCEAIPENECGGLEPLEGAVGDPCGPCDLDLLECAEDGDSLVCDGETECPELDLITTQPTDVEATTATFNGRLDEFPHDEQIVDLGFCWATDDEPTMADDCAALAEVPEDTGEFSLDVDGLRPGTAQYVRAYSETDAGTENYGNAVDFMTEAPAPEGLETESSTDAVLLSWDEVEGAEGYEIHADSDILDTIDDPEQTSYEDESAPAGSLSAPQQVEASTDRTDGIELTWEAAEPVDGSAIEYQIVAVYPDAASAPSEAVEGHRDGPAPSGYELYIGDDEEPGEEDWMLLGDGLDYLDEDAPYAAIDAGEISASKGEYENYVFLEFSEAAESEFVEETYRLRATYGEDDEYSGDTSPETEGHRDVGELQFQWYYTEDSQADKGDFDTLDGADDTTFEDYDAPDDGSSRWYFAEVSADGAETETTDVDEGFVETDDAVVSNLNVPEGDIEATSAVATAELLSAGTPTWEDHGFCWSTEAEPGLEDDCASLGEPNEAEPNMETTLEPLAQGTQYYVRAYVDDSEFGTAYSGEESFTTSAPSPTGLGTETTVDDVTLSWDEADGATGYRVIDSQDEELTEITDPTETSFVHDDIMGGSVGEPQNPQATTDQTDGILITWNDADELAGETVSYRVIAVYPDTESDPSGAVDGTPDAPQITGYEATIAGEDNWVLAPTSEDNEILDEDAPYGSVDAGTASATEGEHDDRVVLSITGAEAIDADDRSYELRATYGANDDPGPETGSFTGERDVGELEYQWYFSDDEQADPQDFGILPDATSANVDDYTAPADGSSRFYFATVSAPGAEASQDTNVDEGYVNTYPGDVDNIRLGDTGPASAEVSADVTELGNPEATEHGFCYSTNTTPPDYPDANCVTLGAPEGETPFDFGTTLENLTADTTYYVHAFIHTDDIEETTYSSVLTFTTEEVPTPTVISASTDDDNEITFEWNEVEGADGYAVYRDETSVGVTAAGETVYVDDSENLDEPALPPAPNDAGATTNDVAEVTITWTDVDADGDNEHQYTVAAIFGPNEGSQSDPVTGYLRVPEVVSYEISTDDGQTWVAADELESHVDADAPPATIDIGNATASDDNEEHIVIDIEDIEGETAAVTVEPGATVTYWVRTVDADDRRSDGHDEADGNRAAGDLVGEWQYRDDPTGEWQFLTNLNVEAPYYEDSEPAGGETREYWAVVEVDGTDDTETESNIAEGQVAETTE